ncbi:CPSF1 [Mytilus coruscus]|uniref:CPSF1 n=1 Tax=Mytilus coruscus TaxID=42192 RepID=A0A6J8BTA3_MYTCO|nr:CPSF1 [Mytilus coruscus]
MYIIWNEFQDSYHDETSNVMFFQKTECQEDGYFSKFTDLLKRLSPIHVATPIGESHTFEIECKNCPFLSKWDCKMTADQTPINIIKMICTCKKKSVKGELCYTTLFAQLDPRLYTHDKKMSFDNNHFILTNKDCIHKNEGETNDGETYTTLNREKVLFTKIPRMSGEEQDKDKTYTDEKMSPLQLTTPLQRLVAEEGSFCYGIFQCFRFTQKSFT